MKLQDSVEVLALNGGTTGAGESSIAAGAERVWRRHLIGFLPIAALYLILGFYRIDHQSLWTDEVISVSRVSSVEPVSIQLNSQSPLYFVLLDLWTETAGTTEFALRSLSTVLGLVAVGLVYVIGLRLFNRRIALFAALLLATSPYLIWYSQEVRYITLMLATSLAMTYSFHRALTSSGWRWWLMYGVTSGLALFTFLTVIFLVLAHGLYLLCCHHYRPFFKKWVASQLIIIALFASWFVSRTERLGAVLAQRPTVVSQEHGRSREKLPLSDVLGTIPYTFFAFSVGFSFGPSLKELHELRSLGTLMSHSGAVVPVGVLFASLFVLGLTRLRQDKETGSFLLLWMGLPIIGAFTVATTTTYHAYNTRYVAMALPAYLLILAVALAGIRRAKIQFALVTVVLGVSAVSLYNYYFDARYARADARAAARYLESAARPQDIIVIVGNGTPLRYYYKGDLPLVPVDGGTPSNESVVTEKVQALITDHSRVWLVEIRSWEKDPNGKVKPALDTLARLIEHTEFSGVQIYSYEH